MLVSNLKIETKPKFTFQLSTLSVWCKEKFSCITSLSNYVYENICYKMFCIVGQFYVKSIYF